MKSNPKWEDNIKMGRRERGYKICGENRAGSVYGQMDCCSQHDNKTQLSINGVV